MRPVAGSSGTASTEHALDRLRRELEPTLVALDRAATDPDALDECGDELPALQYALHAVTEQSLVPLLGSFDGWTDGAYSELDYALAVAREETADVAETLQEAGAAAAAPLIWEWRAALFGVRLALLRLEQRAPVERPDPPLGPRLLPLLLLAAGVSLVLGGALAERVAARGSRAWRSSPRAPRFHTARNERLGGLVSFLQVRNDDPREPKDVRAREDSARAANEPVPTASYRRRAWREFQRALDPLARPKPLRPPRS